MTTTITPPTLTTIAGEDANPFEAAYGRLVAARLEYEMLRTQGAPLGALAEARGVLHRARAAMADERRSRN